MNRFQCIELTIPILGLVDRITSKLSTDEGFVIVYDCKVHDVQCLDKDTVYVR